MNIKQEIIDEYLQGGSSYQVLSAKYGFGRTSIHRWVMQYQGKYNYESYGQSDVALPLMQNDTNQAVPAEVVALQKALAEERLRTKLLTTMIDIAEEQLKIPIRKKYGTKPLKK